MATLKMGMHNRITAERFHAIKAEIALGTGDNKIMQKFNIKTNTLNLVRRCGSFYEYRLRREKGLHKNKPIVYVAPNSGIAFEDYYYNRRKKNSHELSDRLDREAERSAYNLGVWFITILAIFAIFCLVLIGATL